MTTLQRFFTENNRLALAFSGGADSSYLLYAAVSAGAQVKAYYLRTPFQPEFERRDADRLAGELGAALETVEYDILSAPGVRENPADRCCRCKRAMFTLLKARSQEDGFPLLIDGTNASDREEERPGMKALRELGVRSPLRECGIEKDEVRRASREAGLFTWNKPAYSCLATRIKSGQAITAGALDRVETAERALYDLGFSDLRVRLDGGTAKVQLTAEQWDRAAGMRDLILCKLKLLFDTVTLDMEPRPSTGPAAEVGRGA